jgi:hypothetical protein
LKRRAREREVKKRKKKKRAKCACCLGEKIDRNFSSLLLSGAGA